MKVVCKLPYGGSHLILYENLKFVHTREDKERSYNEYAASNHLSTLEIREDRYHITHFHPDTGHKRNRHTILMNESHEPALETLKKMHKAYMDFQFELEVLKSE